MSISINDFLEALLNNRILWITILLMALLIIINGWTDAPNAIATAVGSRALSPKIAVLIAIAFNFLGVFIMTMINSRVAQTIYEMVDFSGNARIALIALLAAILSIVIWATLAWSYGIPTSESHALIASISGSAIALQNGLSGIHFGAWVKVIYGLLLSLFLGFFLGFMITKFLHFIFQKSKKTKVDKIFKKGQIVGAAGLAFLHGAQDGQKFLAVFMLGIFLTLGISGNVVFEIPIWLMFLCSILLALGTSLGGFRIIKSVGLDMVKLNHHQALASDIASGTCLLLASLSGMPVSTTHTKTTSIIGAGLAKRGGSVKWKLALEMVETWVLTFPCCGLLGFFLAKLFIFLA